MRNDLLAVYRANAETGAYELTPAAIGRRRLKNLCLAYLMELEEAPIRQLCAEQYQAGGNMNDRLAALTLLADSDAPQREAALADFYERWQADPLVLDKWFSVQALSRRADTLARVQGLLQNPAFSLRNPNRVRALVGAFCSGNPFRFHAADGSGYAFLTDRVLELNATNPQVAARLLRIMARWRSYDDNRRTLMRSQLQRILATQGLSRNVYEVVAKTLGEDG